MTKAPSSLNNVTSVAGDENRLLALTRDGVPINKEGIIEGKMDENRL